MTNNSERFTTMFEQAFQIDYDGLEREFIKQDSFSYVLYEQLFIRLKFGNFGLCRNIITDGDFRSMLHIVMLVLSSRIKSVTIDGNEYEAFCKKNNIYRNCDSKIRTEVSHYVHLSVNDVMKRVRKWSFFGKFSREHLLIFTCVLFTCFQFYKLQMFYNIQKLERLRICLNQWLYLLSALEYLRTELDQIEPFFCFLIILYHSFLTFVATPTEIMFNYQRLTKRMPKIKITNESNHKLKLDYLDDFPIDHITQLHNKYLRYKKKVLNDDNESLVVGIKKSSKDNLTIEELKELYSSFFYIDEKLPQSIKKTLIGKRKEVKNENNEQ
ncbi:hypothetical protein SNEBB_003467 [Seison nebaliae]|nr:hypothetical protein SNEBB_003467 [Seison nebaliae]